MKLFAKSKIIGLLIGLVIIVMTLPGVAAASTASSTDAQYISDTIPASMTAGQSYTVAVTMRNTGSTAWDEASMFRLGGVGDATGDAVKIGPTRIRIPAGTSVAPGLQYTFIFTMIAPARASTYLPQYQMVWDGHQWFGTVASHSVIVKGVSASTSAVNAQFVSSTIPSSMTAGQSYAVAVTMRNTGSTTWDEASMIRLGGVGDATGDAVKFGPTRIRIPAGTSVAPGSSYTFTFTMTGSASAGTYSPQYMMVWDGHQWFGSTDSQNVQIDGVSGGTSGLSASTSVADAQIVSSTIPSSMNAGQSYVISVTMKNTGTMTWTETSMIRLGGVGDATGDAVKFGPTRIRIPTGSSVAPGSSYTFTFTMTGSASAGTYTPQYMMVWDGHQWFGPTESQSVQVAGVSGGNSGLSASTSMVNTQLVSSTIPASMTAGQNYAVSVTMKNTGSTTWDEASMIRLGGVGDSTGDAVKFGPTRIRIPAGTSVTPGSSYTFSFTLIGPASAGTYAPQYMMVWDGHQWFGPTTSQSVQVANPISSAPPLNSPVAPVQTTTPSPVITISTPSTVSSDGTYGAGGYTGAGPVGGGAGYSDIKTTGTYIVTTLDQFRSHMVGGSQPATSGQVIFIPSGTTITFPAGNTPAIPAGVTLASDRGYNGHAGAILKKSASSGGWTDRMLDIGGNNVRVTGLQLEGEMFLSTSSPVVSEGNYLEGVKNYGSYSGEIVDNNEFRGWAYSAIEVKGVPTAGRPWIHNNYIHNNQARGEGYGIEVYGGDVLVEANIFDYNRHDITGTGVPGEKYEFRYNIILGGCDNPIGGVHVDVHESLVPATPGAGSTFLIHHNTVIQGSGTNQQAFVHVRDIPTTGAYVYNNDIQTNWGSDSNYDGAQTVIYQSHSQTRTVSNWNLFATDNKWKGTVYATNSGIVWIQCGSGSTC